MYAGCTHVGDGPEPKTSLSLLFRAGSVSLLAALIKGRNECIGSVFPGYKYYSSIYTIHLQ